MASNSGIDRLHALFVKLSKQMTEVETRRMIELLTPEKIDERTAEGLKNPYGIFYFLYQRGYIEIDDCSLLKVLLEQIGRKPLISIVDQYMETNKEDIEEYRRLEEKKKSSGIFGKIIKHISRRKDKTDGTELWPQLQNLIDDPNATKEVYRGRIMLVGAFGAGKSSTKRSLLNEAFEEKYISTDGAEIYSIDITNWIIRGSKEHHGKKNPKETRDAMLDALLQNVKKGEQTNAPCLEISVKEDLKEDGEDEDEAFKRIEKRLKNLEVRDTADYHFSLWDFAGQSIYYITHQVFLSYRCIYLIVTDLTKSLDDVLHITHDRDNVEDVGNLWQGHRRVRDFLLFWINSIHTHAMKKDTKGADSIEVEGSSQTAPPVIILGTKKDLINPKKHLNNEAEAKARLKEIRKHLIENAELATEHHLVDLFAVDNKSRERGLVSDPEIQNVRKKIQHLAKEFCFLGNVPIKWLQLELHLRKLQKEIVLIDEVYEIGEKLNIGINEIKKALIFFHDVGEVIHFQGDQELGKMVILDVQWLANLFKVIITQSMAYKDSLSTSPKLVKLVGKLQYQGLLDEELLDSLLTSKNRLQDKNILLSVMEKFDVTCKVPQQPGSSECSIYFLPCLLQNDDESKCHDPEKSELLDPLYFHFPGNFIPDGLFHRLIVRCWREWYVDSVALTRQRARIFIPASNDFYCKVSKVGCDIELQVLRIPSPSEYTRKPDWAKWSSHARKFVEKELDSLISTYTPGLRYCVSLKCRCGTIATGTIGRANEDHCVDISELLEKREIKAGPIVCCHALKIDTTSLQHWYPEYAKSRVGIAKPIMEEDKMASASEPHHVQESVSRAETNESTLKSGHAQPKTIALTQHQECIPSQKQLIAIEEEHKYSPACEETIQETRPSASEPFKESASKEDEVSEAASGSWHGKSKAIAQHQEYILSQGQLKTSEKEHKCGPVSLPTWNCLTSQFWTYFNKLKRNDFLRQLFPLRSIPELGIKLKGQALLLTVAFFVVICFIGILLLIPFAFPIKCASDELQTKKMTHCAQSQGSDKTEDPSNEHMIPVCFKSHFNSHKCTVINLVPFFRKPTRYSLTAGFCLGVPGYAINYPLRLYIMLSPIDVYQPKLEDFEHIESHIIEIFPRNERFKQTLTLGFRVANNQTLRPHVIMASDDGVSWKELPSTQRGSIVITQIERTGYFFVKSKPYTDYLNVNEHGCEYICPVSSHIRMYIPSGATTKPLSLRLTIVFENHAIASAAFGYHKSYKNCYNGSPVIISPILYIEEESGQSLKFREKVTIRLPVLQKNCSNEVFNDWKTHILEDRLQTNDWQDITGDVIHYIHHHSASFRIDHFSAYFILRTLAPGITTALAVQYAMNYVLTYQTGTYLVNIILLQEENHPNSLLLDCVNRIDTEERIVEMTKKGYTEAEKSVRSRSRDIDVTKGHEILISVNGQFTLSGEHTPILQCFPDRRNNIFFLVERKQNVHKHVVNWGSVDGNLNGKNLVHLIFNVKGTSSDTADSDTEQIKGHERDLTNAKGSVQGDEEYHKRGKSVLILNDEWGTSKGGVSTVHRQIAKRVKDAGFDVYVTALDQPSEQDRIDAERKGIKIIIAKKKSKRQSDISWITEAHETYFPDIEDIPQLEIIIGHIPITGEGALDIGKERLHGKRVFQFIHVIPEDTEVFKNDSDINKTYTKEKDILNLARRSDAVFSVGPRIYNNYDGKFRNDAFFHGQYTPYPDNDFFSLKVTSPERHHPVRILTFGRFEGVAYLKGYDLVAEALSELCNDNKNLCPKWDIRGIPNNKQDDCRKFLKRYIKSKNLHYNLLPHGTHEDIQEDIKQSHLFIMSSRIEPFGMVGMEAIAAGIPVLITSHSGLATYMKEHFGVDAKLVTVDVGLNDYDREDDIKIWKEQIQEVIQDINARFDKAQEFKEKLMKKAARASHDEFEKQLY